MNPVARQSNMNSARYNAIIALLHYLILGHLLACDNTLAFTMPFQSHRIVIPDAFDFNSKCEQGFIGHSTAVRLAFEKGPKQFRPSSATGTSLSSKSSNDDTFFCESCGIEHVKWVGRCTSCKEWNTVKLFKQAKITSGSNDGLLSIRSKVAQSRSSASSPSDGNELSRVSSPLLPSSSSRWLQGSLSNGLIKMSDINTKLAISKTPVFSAELSRVLGGGLVSGSVILLAGEPGIGKSTLLIQMASHLGQVETASHIVYLSGEETPEQIASRADRLSLDVLGIYVLSDVDIDAAIDNILSLEHLPKLVIIDSIQTVYTNTCTGSVGTITQIRDCAARIIQFAKASGIAVLLIGHVTKSGEVAGPRILEHMVDTVLYLEGSEQSDFRLLRSVKNRFGSTHEIGVFAMSTAGMLDVKNPSELFMSSSIMKHGVEGSAVSVILEGSRCIFAEIQCLVGSIIPSHIQKVNSRRASEGFPMQRLLLICAVIEKRLKMNLWNRDVYVNVVGGLKVNEPMSDLAVAVTIISSLLGIPVGGGIAFIGEIGLGGEIRGGRNIDLRISEARNMGFRTIVIPTSAKWTWKQNDHKLKGNESGAEDVIACGTVKDALAIAFDIVSVDEWLRSKNRKKKSTSMADEDDVMEEETDDADNDIKPTKEIRSLRGPSKTPPYVKNTGKSMDELLRREEKAISADLNSMGEVSKGIEISSDYETF